MNSIGRGSIIEHPEHGRGVVTFVGDDYIGMCFDNGGNALLKRSSFERREEDEKPAQSMIEEVGIKRTDLPWPDSTFVFEGDDEPHYMGSHWSPFMNDVTEVLQRLPEVLPQAFNIVFPKSFK